MEKLKKTWVRRRKTGCLICLALILYALLVTIFGLYFQLMKGWMLYLVPYAFLSLFLNAWFNPAILILALSIAPLVGWILRVMRIKAGKYVIVISELIVLAMNVIVTVLHLILALGVKDSSYAAVSALLAISGVIVPALILWAVHVWDPN